MRFRSVGLRRRLSAAAASRLRTFCSGALPSTGNNGELAPCRGCFFRHDAVTSGLLRCIAGDYAGNAAFVSRQGRSDACDSVYFYCSPFMRLLHVIPDLDPRSGGTVSALVGLAIAQARLGWQVSVLTTISGDDFDCREITRLRTAGVSVTTISVNSRLSSIKPIRQAAAAAIADADRVHVHAVWEELQHQACLAAYHASVPTVISPHGMLDPWSLSQSRLKKRAYLAVRLRRNLNRATAIHCTTVAEANLIAPLRIAAPSFVIPNGIDLSEFQSTGETNQVIGGGGGHRQNTFSDRFPIVRGRQCLLFLSRLHPKKGLDLLLPAFARLATPDLILVLAGPGDPDYVDLLRQECQRLSITERVLFTGMLNGSERVAAFRAADLFVLPSYQENFGIAVIESLAAGTPVIISDQVNLADEIRDSDVGEVVSTDLDDIHQAISRWVADPLRCRRAGELGKRFASDYDFAIIAQTWKERLDR